MKQFFIIAVTFVLGIFAVTGLVSAQTATPTNSPTPTITTTTSPTSTSTPTPTGSVQGTTTVAVPNAAPATGHAR